MGVIGRPHGVRGLLHVHSYATDPTDLARYELSDERGRRFALRWRSEGVAELAEIVAGKPVKIADRTAAEALVNVRLSVPRTALPATEDDEFYLADLVGMQACAPDGAVIGEVQAVHDYGAGASLEIGRVLLPFTRACVPEIDLAAGRMTVVAPAEVDAR